MGILKRIKRTILLLLAFVNILGHSSIALANELPYDTYNYNFYEDIVYTPAAYVPSRSISGTRLYYEGEPLGCL